jgi:hypothetical protein
MRNKVSVLAVLLLIVAAVACSIGDAAGNRQSVVSGTERMTGYSLKGIKFAYYKIGKDLSEAELIETAQKIHDAEPDTQIILVDDDSRLADYVAYVKAVSGPGDVTLEMPLEWADEHIVANIQKYMSGKFVLCKGYGYMEIADLK